MPQQRSFAPATFAFLRDLAKNNDREWFKENRMRYESAVRDPALEFITDFEPALRRISRHFVADARPSGGSLFRIYRDTRFGKDKSPYKTHTGIHFRHEEAKDAHAPGFYLHIEPGSVFAGCGIWHPDTVALAKIRDHLVADSAGWRRAVGAASFRKHFTLAGESLVRAPRGYDPEHELIDDLRRKDFIGVAKLTQTQITSAGFLGAFEKLCRDAAPFQRFLCAALGAAY